MDIYIGNINDYTTEYLSGLVSAGHAKAAERYRFDADRRRTLLAHALLDHEVSLSHPDMPLPVDPVVDEYGKPHLYPVGLPEFHFSLSHSGDHSICAVSSGPVGADIEKIGNDKENIAERFFAEEERNYISDADSFYMIWTLKESFMKALGLGMRLPMESFTVTGLDKVSGICSFKPCGYTFSDNAVDTVQASFVDPVSGNYMISGMTLKEIPGYALSFATYNMDTGRSESPDLHYPSL